VIVSSEPALDQGHQAWPCGLRGDRVGDRCVLWRALFLRP